MDGITLAAVKAELETKLIGAKIEKIYQPEKDELILLFRSGERLLLTSNANNCRVQLTQTSRKNPTDPPMFCMLLRKHLTGGKIQSISQPNFDRILHIDIQSTDELGNLGTYTLICEIMGKHSNVILIRENIIIDAIKHITPVVSSVRVIMPGVSYTLPPQQNKQNPLEATLDSIHTAMQTKSGCLAKIILQTWSGISPFMAKEIALRACADNISWESCSVFERDIAVQHIALFFTKLQEQSFKPQVILDDFGEAIACLPIDSIQYTSKSKQAADSISEALDRFYCLRDQSESMKQKSSSLLRILHNNIERCEKKLAIQRDILASSAKIDAYRLFGELITASAYKLKRGSFALVENYYDENLTKINIPLDCTLSPAENAQRYFKKYNKAKAALSMADEQIHQISRELAYLEGQADNIEKCTEENELLEIRYELIKEGYVRPEKGRKKPAKTVQSKPLHYLSSDGLHIYVGKNNVQNDYLTLRFAQNEDIWLHTKNIPGSHVIIVVKGKVPDRTLLEAAQLAAYYSKGKNSSNVPVDYAARKFVKKPAGAQPGYVIYSSNKTIVITPEEKSIKSLTTID